MQLIVNGSEVLDDPTPEDVQDALEGLPGGDVDSFAVLSDHDEYFMQTVGSTSEGFHVEYRAGFDESHFMAPGRLTLDDTSALFESYLRGDESYKHSCGWTVLPPAPPTRGSGSVLIVLLGSVIAFGLFVGFRFMGVGSSRYAPLAMLGAVLGIGQMWLVLGPLRKNRQYATVAWVVLFSFLGAAQLFLGNDGVGVLGMAWAVGALALMLGGVIWKSARSWGEA